MKLLHLLKELDFSQTLENIAAQKEHLNPDLQNELKRMTKYVDLANN
jgi:hypothetical protein